MASARRPLEAPLHPERRGRAVAYVAGPEPLASVAERPRPEKQTAERLGAIHRGRRGAGPGELLLGDLLAGCASRGDARGDEMVAILVIPAGRDARRSRRAVA